MVKYYNMKDTDTFNFNELHQYAKKEHNFSNHIVSGNDIITFKFPEKYHSICDIKITLSESKTECYLVQLFCGYTYIGKYSCKLFELNINIPHFNSFSNQFPQIHFKEPLHLNMHFDDKLNILLDTYHKNKENNLCISYYGITYPENIQKKLKDNYLIRKNNKSKKIYILNNGSFNKIKYSECTIM